MADPLKAMCIISVTYDEGRTWKMLKAAEVPEWVKDPDVMANLIAGEFAQAQGGFLLPEGARPWYKAERVDANGATLQ